MIPNSIGRPTGYLGASPSAQAAFRLGWNDVVKNRGWNLGYDYCPKPIQKSYEEGRLEAWNVLACGLFVPDWTLENTHEIIGLASTARSMIGGSVPPVRIEGSNDSPPRYVATWFPLSVY